MQTTYDDCKTGSMGGNSNTTYISSQKLIEPSHIIFVIAIIS